MNLRERHEHQASIYTDSMADISFLLVIFFLVTAVIALSRGLDWHLPDGKDDVQVVEPQESIDVHVLGDGSLRVDKKAMAMSGLLPYVKGVLAENPSKYVILRTDPDATYQAMIATLDELRQAPDRYGFEIRNLAIPTLREQGGWAQFGIE